MKKRTHVGVRQLGVAMCLACLALCFAIALTLTPTFHSPARPAPGQPHAQIVAAKTPQKHRHRWFQIGKASWYGRDFQGKTTATGEMFDMHALTCAHRTLPLGTWLRVTNLANRRSTLVRVNDRGPFVSDTIVDLSYAAARKVGIFGKSRVRVDTVSATDPEVLRAELESPGATRTAETE